MFGIFVQRKHRKTIRGCGGCRGHGSYRGYRSGRGQAWVSDYTISMLLFVIAAIIAAKIIVNNFSTDTAYEEIKNDASRISQTLLSQGYPAAWTNESDVIRPGLMTGTELNHSKIVSAMNMSYSGLKTKFNTPYSFLIVFEEPGHDLIEFEGQCAIGSPEPRITNTTVPSLDCHYANFTGLNYDNMIMINRLTMYESQIIRMKVYVWD